MPRGRKPSPNKALKAHIKKLTSERSKANREVKKYERVFNTLGKKLGVLERKMNVIKHQMGIARADFTRAETVRDELSSDISSLKAQL